MKFKKCVIIGLISTGAFGASALADDISDALNQLAKGTNGPTSAWPELENFQTALWRTMALDPGPVNVIPIDSIPKALFADELTTALTTQLENLKRNNISQKWSAEAEFSQYAATVSRIIALRSGRHFPQSRAFAKSGTLDEQYSNLIKKFNSGTSHNGIASREDSVRKIENYIQTLKEKKSSVEAKSNPFSNGDQFIWAALIAIIGFIFGMTAIRMNPEFFEKFFSSEADAKTPVKEKTATATTTHNQLNYARWLREFEEHLALLKTSQFSHERRIEEVAQLARTLSNVPKFVRLAEAADALKTGERTQIHVTLEHCLKLCDAIEAGGVDRSLVPALYRPENQAVNQ